MDEGVWGVGGSVIHFCTLFTMEDEVLVCQKLGSGELGFQLSVGGLEVVAIVKGVSGLTLIMGKVGSESDDGT